MQTLNKLVPTSLNGDLRRGGYLVNAIVAGDTDAVSRWQNVIFDGKSLCQFRDLTWREWINGHTIAAPDNLQVSRYNTQAQIRLGTYDAILRGLGVQDISFTEQSSPANEHQITGLQMVDIVNHIIRGHCNAVYNATTMPDGVITTLTIDTTNSTPVEYFNTNESRNLWSVLQKIGGGENGGEFYTCWFNRKNEFYYQPTPAFWTTPPTSKGTLTADHIKGMTVKINNNQPGQQIGQVEMLTVKDFDTVYQSIYPANPGDGRKLRIKNGVWADSQARSDTLATRKYQWDSRQYTVVVELDVGLILYGDDGSGLDLADKVTLTYDGPTTDATTGHGFHVNFNAQDFFVYGININNFDVAGKNATGTVTLEMDPT